MKDKEKQIEEMASIIKAVKYEPFNDGKPTYTVGNQMSDFVFGLIAEELLKHYQPKLPKDSVVLSIEEFKEKIKQVKDLEKNYYKNVVIPQERKKIAEKIYRELQGHGTTYVKKWIEKEFGVEIKE